MSASSNVSDNYSQVLQEYFPVTSSFKTQALIACHCNPTKAVSVQPIYAQTGRLVMQMLNELASYHN